MNINYFSIQRLGAYFILIWCMVSGLACGVTRHSSTISSDLKHRITESSVFNNHFTGFMLYDPIANKSIYEYNSSKYFTPASNTKILTLYTAMCSFPDTLPAFQYAFSGGRLYLKGIGDPTFLHELWQNHPAFTFLSNSKEQIYLVADVLKDEMLGSGWAWDDYQYAYQAERSAWPLYGNLVHFQALDNSYRVVPTYFQSKWSSLPQVNSSHPITRSPRSNEFVIYDAKLKNQNIPFHTDIVTIKNLMQDTLHREIHTIWSSDLDPTLQWQMMPGVPADSVYSHMMTVSDNFIAEQLLLMSAAYTLDTCHTGIAIDRAIKNYFAEAPDKMQWYDGSGLSRYNLFTPRTIVYVLDKILDKTPIVRIKKIFPTGGLTGTISQWYGSATPYVFAKTGSLMNNHSLSGYILTKQHKVLIFSFMHSNYTGSVLPIRREMQQTLEFIRDQY